MRRTRWAGLVAWVVVATAALGACGDDEDASDSSAGGEVVVLAAASLIDVLTELGNEFEDAKPGIDVTFDFGPSSGLATSIVEGAPADVFAPADDTSMATVVGAGLARGPQVFARNLLQLAVPAGNPGDVEGIDDLADGDLLVGLCAADVPCGRLARELLADAGVTPSLDTEEPDVRALLTKLIDGELDAGIVYRTDVEAAAGDVVGIVIPGAEQHPAVYSIIEVVDGDGDGDEPDSSAAEFVEFVLSDRGRQVLAKYGFTPG